MGMQRSVLVLSRRNPVRLAQRDVVLPAGDGWRLLLLLRLAEADAAEAADVGAGGGIPPPVRVTVFRGGAGARAYGWPAGPVELPVWRGWGVPAAGEPPGVCVVVPEAVTAGWQGRYGFCVQAEVNGTVLTLARGTLLVVPGWPMPVLGDAIQDDAGGTILGDSNQTMEVAHAAVD